MFKFLLAPFVIAELVLPLAPNAYILDEADVISPEAEEEIEEILTLLEKENSTEIAVVTVTSLQDYPIEEFSIELAREWGIGQKDFNNGVLVLVAPREREMRIEVGYGLEGAIPDALANSIIGEIMTPNFQLGDYDTGLIEAVKHLDSLARGEDYGDSAENPFDTDYETIFIVFLVVVFMSLVLGRIFWGAAHFLSDSKSWWVGGIIGGYLAYFIIGSITALVVGLVGGLLLDLILSTIFYKKIKKHKSGKNGRGGFWGGGGTGGGGFGGFGGGGFGGGGASGRF